MTWYQFMQRQGRLSRLWLVDDYIELVFDRSPDSDPPTVLVPLLWSAPIFGRLSELACPLFHLFVEPLFNLRWGQVPEAGMRSECIVVEAERFEFGSYFLQVDE